MEFENWILESVILRVMWREWSTNQRKNSEFLAEAVERVSSTLPSPLTPLPKGEGKVCSIQNCPQSADTHAEGPVVEDHLRLMQRVLEAVIQGDLHLGDIEEFRRLKNFTGEFDEIEETIKEKAASLEVFILSHDWGKPETICFSAHEGSEGAGKGFHDSLAEVLTRDNKNRNQKIERYNQEFQKFSKVFKNKKEAHAAFLSSHQISISYHGYAQAVAHPKFREKLTELGNQYRLTIEETEDVFHLIILHEKTVTSFSFNPSLAAHNHLVKYAAKYGRDADDFLDLLLAAVFLEICATPRFKAHGIFFDTATVTNFLISEHESLPNKRQSRLKKRQEKKLKSEREKFRVAKLDGNDLMKLFNMKPCREFGKLLAEAQTFAKNQGALPNDIPEEAKEELFKRVEKFRKL